MSNDNVEIRGRARSTEDLRWLEEQLGFAKDQFLRDRGWKHSSSYPGSQWLWSKKIEDVEYKGVTTSSAIHMESWLDCINCRCEGESEDAITDPNCPVHGTPEKDPRA
jgi:hypothetical protein